MLKTQHRSAWAFCAWRILPSRVPAPCEDPARPLRRPRPPVLGRSGKVTYWV